MGSHAHSTAARPDGSRGLSAAGPIVETAAALDTEGIMGALHRLHGIRYWGLALLAGVRNVSMILRQRVSEFYVASAVAWSG
jgi:hypothetical protein